MTDEYIKAQKLLLDFGGFKITEPWFPPRESPRILA
jgi:hypothetical protein